MEKKEIIFADWIYYNERQTDKYTFRSVSIWPKFLDFYDEHKDEKWYVNIDLKVSKNWKPYAVLNTWKPKQKDEQADDMPF